MSLVAPEPDLLAAVRAAPEDDTPRLVLADWLQEHGHPWGEFIAVQCALEREMPPNAVRAVLLRREHALLEERGRWWPYDGTGYEVEAFARGFPARIRADSAGGLRTLPKRMPWLPDVELVSMPLAESDMLALAGLPRLPTRGLSFVASHDYMLDRLDARMLLRWLGARGLPLRRFGFHGSVQTRALDALFDAPLFAHGLEDLTLAFISAWFAWSWVKAPIRLRRLALTLSDLQTLPREVARGLESFELTHVSGSTSLAALLLLLSNVRAVDFASARLDDDALVRLLDAAPPSLRSLGLAQNRLSNIEVLAARPLASLELTANPIGDAGAEVLAGMALTSLDVSTTGLTEHGARALLESPTLPPTLRLSVSRSEVGSVLPALRERFAVVHAR